MAFTKFEHLYLIGPLAAKITTTEVLNDFSYTLLFTVSCAVQQTKGPHWDVPTGRRDGRRSVKQDALDNLPAPFFDAGRNLFQFFVPKGFDAKDQIVLLGKIYKNSSELNSMCYL